MDPFGWLQTVLNRAGMRHNGLYDSLRNNERVRDDLSLSQRLGLIALFPVGMLLALPLCGVLRLLRRAGTLILVARKPNTVRD